MIKWGIEEKLKLANLYLRAAAELRNVSSRYKFSDTWEAYWRTRVSELNTARFDLMLSLYEL